MHRNLRASQGKQQEEHKQPYALNTISFTLDAAAHDFNLRSDTREGAKHTAAGCMKEATTTLTRAGFKKFRCASILIAAIETMHMIKKGQLNCPEGQVSSAAEQFYSLAF
jgi:hypothetical protein